MKLAVELYGKCLGVLEGDNRDFDFHVSSEALAEFGQNSLVLSTAIPLTQKPVRSYAERRRNWFRELLPEGEQYEHMLMQGGLRRGDTLGFLARYGRDVAGALQIWDLDDPTEPLPQEVRRISERQVRGLLEDPLGMPLGNDKTAGKSSLGGVQPKIVLVKDNEGWAQPLGGYPTTHILKPQLTGTLKTTIFDEEYAMRLAKELGITSVNTEIVVFAGLPTLVIERYDREAGSRVHQEDFNQALGAAGNNKYQEVGGVVSLQRIAQVLRRNATLSEVEALGRQLVFSCAVGNLDMHTKNVSLLHHRSGQVTLAPAYDVVPQTHMPNDGKMALAINKKYRHHEITYTDLVAELSSWGLPRSDGLVNEVLKQTEGLVTQRRPLPGAYEDLQTDILTSIARLAS